MANQDTQPDIFISYAQEDGQDARGVAGFLDSCGYNVWWDRKLVSGSNYRKEILSKLTSARAAIVIWTPNSVESNWVIEEAEEAKDANKLIALRQDNLDYRSIPLGFRSVQTDLVNEHERIVTALERLGVPPKQKPWIDPAPLDPNPDDRIARLEQFERWEEIKNSKNPEAYTQFLAKYPNGAYSALARTELSRQAADAWRRIGGSDDIAALKEFVEIFPDDMRAGEARRLIESLRSRKEEIDSWERVKKSTDIAAVEAHVFRFPGGSTAAAARELLQALYLERHAAEHWRAIEGSNQAEDFEQFLDVYSASSYAVTAKHRRDELRRAREEEDWQSIPHERHATPIIKFIRRYPDGRHAPEAIRLLNELPGKVEDEAWAEIKDCQEPIIFEAFLTAFPEGKHAAEVLARHSRPLERDADASKPETARRTEATKPEANRPEFVSAAAAPPRRRTKIIVWVVAILLAMFVLGTTADALGRMTYQYAGQMISTNLLASSIAISGIALLMIFFGQRLYPGKNGDRVRRSYLFAALAGILVLGWLTATQALGESNHRLFGRIDNIRRGVAPGFLGVFAAAVIVALFSYRFPKSRFVFYGLMFILGLMLLSVNIALMNGFIAHDYWVTACLSVFGGFVLMALMAVAAIRDIVHLRRA